MPDISWGILPGAVVIEKKTWDRIPADLQAKLLQIAQDTGNGLRATLRKQSIESIDVMKKNGLNVIELTPAQKAQWISAAEKSYPAIRGSSVPAGIFDEVQQDAQAYRASHK